ncbi:hypothetical protein QWY85_17025 [Neolewinella lacunae]|uniref:Uncharacterized protein n=1 Tax=Neolewinella lacunae TaxID=1517758 RepID=A0A923PL46_9BACT|nr:hypothetical protein [Neolewinella lacunae]MBC6993676.1 hypothetical protein [Neolewinella lacunae]MDN3636371.1 hypothetical protein [Neolewinella lacunae]
MEDFVMLDVPATGLSSNDSNSIVAVISAEQWGEGGGQLHPTTIYFVDVLSCKVIKKIIPGGWGRDIVFNSLAKSWPHASDELLYHFFPEEDFILAKPMPKTQAELQELSRIEYFRMKEQPDKDPKLILQELGYKKIEL